MSSWPVNKPGAHLNCPEITSFSESIHCPCQLQLCSLEILYSYQAQSSSIRQGIVLCGEV